MFRASAGSSVFVLLLAGLAHNAALPAAAQAPADTEQVYRVGPGITAPRLIARENPEYTDEARQKNIRGAVVMKVVIGVDGQANSIQVAEGLGHGLDEKAIECVQRWRFQPGEKDGKPVPIRATIEMNFRLPESARLRSSKSDHD